MALGKFTESEAWFKKALVTEGDDSEIWEHLGDLYAKQGKTSLAIETYKKALTKDPSNKSLEKKILN